MGRRVWAESRASTTTDVRSRWLNQPHLQGPIYPRGCQEPQKLSKWTSIHGVPVRSKQEEVYVEVPTVPSQANIKCAGEQGTLRIEAGPARFGTEDPDSFLKSRFRRTALRYAGLYYMIRQAGYITIYVDDLKDS